MAFIPLYDTNPLRFIRWPYVNWGLIALNILIFVVVQDAGLNEDVNRAAVTSFGLIPATLNNLAFRPEEYAVVPDSATLLTYAFFHGDFWHIAGNMLFLFVFGDNVEDSLGHIRYLIFYCLSAVGAGLAFYFSVPSSEGPLIGASGAIAGVVAAYLILHPHAKIWVLILARSPLRSSALWILGFWVLFQFWGIISAGPDEEIAYWAHIGGFVSGAVLVLFLRRPGVKLFDRGTAAG
jgi:membrane associated rhomboid family serine protease